MVKSIKTRKFEDLDFNLVRDLLKLFLKWQYSCWSMEELILEMKKLGYGQNKVMTTVKVLVRYRVIYCGHTKVYRSVIKNKFVRGKIMVYKHSIGFEHFVESFLSLCDSEKQQKGGTGKDSFSTIPQT